MCKVCEKHGFAVKDKNNFYYPSDYVYGAGSINPHQDADYSLSVGVLIATRPLSNSFESNNECFLFTKGKFLTLTVGKVFLFDSDAEHAWMANCRWLIASQLVKLRRNR